MSAGRYPAFDYVRGSLAKWIKSHRPGYPVAAPPAVKKRAVSSSADYNQFFEAVGEDIACLYEQAWDVLERLRSAYIVLSDHERYMASRLGLLTLNRPFVGDDFSTCDRVDLTETTALVDLSAGEVRLDEVVSDTVFVNLDEANVSFEIVSPYITYETLSPLACMFDGADNTYWLVRAKSPTPGDVTVSVTVDIGTPVELNKVEVEFHGRPPDVKLLTSTDGKDWDEHTGVNSPWFFSSARVRLVRLLMSKSQDGKSEQYDYYFGIKNLTVCRTGIVERGILVSRPFVFDAAVVNKLRLLAETETPPLTSVDFYLSLGENSDIWLPVQPGEIDLGIMDRREVSFSTVDVNDTVGGITTYILGPGFEVDTVWSPELYCGVDKYLRGRAYLNAEVDYVPSLTDWENITPCAKVYSYRDKGSLFATDTYLNVDQLTDNFFCYVFYIYSPSVNDKWVYFSVSDGYRFSGYLNNNLLSVAGSRALLHLVPGWNEFVFLVYNYDSNKRTGLGLTWDWILGKEVVRARREPFEYVAYPSLNYRTPPGMVGRYSLIKKDNLWHPVINFDPADRGLRPQDFTLIYGVPRVAFNALRFKAVLERKPAAGHVTPRLKYYYLELN